MENLVKSSFVKANILPWKHFLRIYNSQKKNDEIEGAIIVYGKIWIF